MFAPGCCIACIRLIVILNRLMVVSVDGSGAVSVSVVADALHFSASPS